MITKLTREQEKGIFEWQQHCLKIGRDTSPINKELVEKSWKKFYGILDKKEPLFWYCQSPLQAQIIMNIFSEVVKIFKILDKRANIWANIGANIMANIRDNVKKLNFTYINTYSLCQHDIDWIGFYKYFEKYGLLPHDRNFEIFDIWYDLACSCGWCYTFENIVFVCEKPKKIFLNNRGQLHKDGAMALEYSDSYGLYMLNGVRMPKEIVETPAEKIDPKLALSEKNTDVQREIIRKVGYEKILKVCNAKTIEEWRCPKTGLIYKIQIMEIGNIKRRYLCYEHAQMPGVFYAKCLPPEAKTIIQMRAFQTGVFGFEPEKAREGLKNNTLTDDELLAELPEIIQ
jgi:hypothetical protein